MRKSDRSQINEINVVPYVDVMLVLLVVFMVTAPLLVQGIKIHLPETTASVLDESELEELTLTIDKKGQFFIEFESYKNKSSSESSKSNKSTSQIYLDLRLHCQSFLIQLPWCL